MAETKKKTVKWRPNCSVCQYMKNHPDYREAVAQSSYFNPDGQESLLAVNARMGTPFKLPTLYRHMQRHQAKDIENAELGAGLFGGQSQVWQRRTIQTAHKPDVVADPAIQELLSNTEEVVEQDVIPRQAHEVALDDFIKLGRAKLRKGEMVISASNFIAAVKVKSDIEKSTKDRRLEMLKSMFAGAAPKQVQPGDSNGST